MNETINREDLYLFQTGKARQAYPQGIRECIVLRTGLASQGKV